MGLTDRLGAVGRLPHDLEVGGRADDHLQPGAHQVLVVHEQHRGPLRHGCTSRGNQAATR